MKITKVTLPKDNSLGLEKISMSRLGQLVLIAGKNGSGKTRLLSCLRSQLKNKPTRGLIMDQKRAKEIHQDSIKKLQARIEFLDKSFLNKMSDNVLSEKNEILEQIENRRNKIIEIDNQISWSLIETDIESDKYTIIDFVPKNLNIRPCSSESKIGLKNLAESAGNIGIESLVNSAFSKIQHVVDCWFVATHPELKNSDLRQEEAIYDYQSLCNYVKIFLNTDLTVDNEGNACIFDKPLDQSNLSDGQKVIIQFCIALYSQSDKLENLIFFMDEPENHLHPEALIAVVDSFLKVIPNGQLWIATHSVNLLAHYDPSSIWYMQNGAISYAGNIPEKVLEGLLGSEQEIFRLSNFLSLPAQMATLNFSYQCLLEPQVLTTNIGDPQTTQIIEAIQSKQGNEKIKVLDFGAGKGRLLSTILELSQYSSANIAENLDYYAYDIQSPDNEQCQNLIEKVYIDSNKRFFNIESDVINEVQRKTFDFIILSNVFHELDPRDWLNIFGEHSLIRTALSDGGYLLVVEDQFLPVGEKAYKNGFLVLDQAQFKILFDIDKYYAADARGDGRLKAHFIPSTCLRNINSDSRRKAIENLSAIARQKITELRDIYPSFSNGRLHAFWVHQLANSNLILSEL